MMEHEVDNDFWDDEVSVKDNILNIANTLSSRLDKLEARQKKDRISFKDNKH